MTTDFIIQYPPGSRPDILATQLRDFGDLVAVAEPALSVISPSYNTGKYLEETIRSIANQSFRNFEHIVVDGGSTDETLSVLKKYPHIRWISEKDRGADEAILKGVKMARGRYIMVCCVSDGYANTDWFKSCVEYLDSHPDVSLVYGYPQFLSEDGIAMTLGYHHFQNKTMPSGEQMFKLFLMSSWGMPEGNLCVDKKIMEQCFPSREQNVPFMDPWNRFNFNFFEAGYLPQNLPVLANFGRWHPSQLGQRLKQSGQMRINNRNYHRLINNLRRRILLGRTKVCFIGRDGRPLGMEFNRGEFFRQYLKYLFSPNRLLEAATLCWYLFKRIPNKLKEKFGELNTSK